MIKQLKNSTVIFILIIFPYLATQAQSGLKLHNNNRLTLNTDNFIGSSDFVIRSTYPTGYGGMYIESMDMVSGKPFYGYANNGNVKAWHFYNQEAKTWELSFGSFNGIFRVKDNGQMLVNSSTLIGSSDFTLTSANPDPNGYGGMYLNSGSGKPFYGYAIGGVNELLHYYDRINNTWNITFGENATETVLSLFQTGYLKLNGTVAAVNVNSSGANPAPGYRYSGNNVDLASTYFSTTFNRWILDLKNTNTEFYVSDQGKVTIDGDVAGMDVRTFDTSNPAPYYSYSILGQNERARHFFDGFLEQWILKLGSIEAIRVRATNGNVSIGGQLIPHEKLEIGGAIKIDDAAFPGNSPEGTIRFDGTTFLGKIGSSWYDLVNGGVAARNYEQELEALKAENEELKNKLSELESKINTLIASTVKQ